MQKRKALNIAGIVVLILCGWTLEIYYYYFRYVSDGVPSAISIITGVSLTLLLTMLARYYDKKSAVVVSVILLMYSVFCTSTGQDVFVRSIVSAESEVVIEKTESNNSVLDEKNRYLAEIKILNDEYSYLMKTKSAGSESVKERANWITTIQGIESRMNEISSEKKRYEGLIKELPQVYAEKIVPESSEVGTYEAFGNYSRPVQYASQIFLSIFIAIMAPSGMLMLKSVTGAEQERQPQQNEQSADRWVDHVKTWVDISYRLIDQRRADYLVQRINFMEHIEKHDKTFTGYRYDQIRQAAIRAGVMRKEGSQYFPLVTDKNEAVKLILDNI